MPARSTPAPGSIDPEITVVVAQDHGLMRKALRILLDQTEGLRVCAEAQNLALTLQHVAGHQPDVLVLDMHMPDGSSLETLRTLRANMPRTRVVVTGDDSGSAVARYVLAAGASAYVRKDNAPEKLADAVRAAGRESYAESAAADAGCWLGGRGIVALMMVPSLGLDSTLSSP